MPLKRTRSLQLAAPPLRRRRRRVVAAVAAALVARHRRLLLLGRRAGGGLAHAARAHADEAVLAELTPPPLAVFSVGVFLLFRRVQDS